MQKIKKISYQSLFGKNKKTITHSNVKIFKNEKDFVVEYIGGNYKCYDYVINDLLITTRMAFSEHLLNLLHENNVHPLDYNKKFEMNKELNETA